MMAINNTSHKDAIQRLHGPLKAKIEQLSDGTQILLSGFKLVVLSGLLFLLCMLAARGSAFLLAANCQSIASMLQFAAGVSGIGSFICLARTAFVEVIAMAIIAEEARSPMSGWHYGFASMQVTPVVALTIFGPFGLMYLFSRDELGFAAIKAAIKAVWSVVETILSLLSIRVQLTPKLSVQPLLILVGLFMLGFIIRGFIKDIRKEGNEKEK